MSTDLLTRAKRMVEESAEASIPKYVHVPDWVLELSEDELRQVGDALQQKTHGWRPRFFVFEDGQKLPIPSAILTVPRCIYPSCCNSRRTRGLCHQHYQTMRSYVRDNKATEADLEARGLLLAKGGGGSPVSDHSAFLTGSDVRGEEN